MESKIILKKFLILTLFLVSTVQASDNFYGFGAGMVLLDVLNRQWPANVCVTTDGNGNVIPISAGGGGGGAVTQGTTPWVVSAASLPLPTGAATSASQSTANSSLSTIVTNTNTPTTGSISNNVSVTTVASTFTAPANAVGFVLEAESGNTANIRWAIGSTATASVGMLAEPGRDTGYIPGSANISVIAISGTQAVSVQWIVK